VVIYFWRDLGRAIGAWGVSLFNKDARKTDDARLGWAVFFGTIPIIVLGLLFEDQIKTVLRSSLVVACSLIVVAAVMWLAEAVSKRTRDLTTVGPTDGWIVGLWQSLALVPGVSRSGSTISGSLFLGMDRPTAARFSFLLSVPSVFASGIYELFKERHALMESGALPTLVATVVAFISGYAAIAFLITYLQKHSTAVFIGYRIALGAVLLLLIFNGVLAQ
jgi:undecaprenyl-diphosphatase